MREVLAIDGNTAVAHAMRQVNPDVIAAYPITPQTSTVQTFSQFVADGQVKTEFVTVESEHSAMSACVGAAAAGARVMTATASAGLALMWEILTVASGLRLPIVMLIANRALSAPLNIHGDHSDAMGARDSSWIQLFSENPQESYHNMLQAVRIGEHPDVQLPVIVNHDGFITSHGMERVELFTDEEVQRFVGEYTPHQTTLLEINKPVTYGPVDFYDYYFEHKRQQVDAMEKATNVILEVGKEFEKLCGRRYELFETYMLDDADVAIVVMSSAAGTTRAVIDRLRAEGKKVGMLKPRVFRPFPAQQMADALSHVKAVGVMDRSISYGAMGNAGALYLELLAAQRIYGGNMPAVDYVFGLGGRDVPHADIESVYNDLFDILETGKIKDLVTFLGVRE
jgi:pyruvate ferredoxin oxidoreductase alpha subunit